MHYDGLIIRPPSEADSILLQVTVGCSHNKCTFCAAYKDKRFTIKPDEIILEDLAYAARHYQWMKRVFLCDGDALVIPQERLLRILREIRKTLPWVERVGTYANAKSLGAKSLEQLRELKANGLQIAYMGLESGDDETLKAVRKKGDAATMIREGRKCREAGIMLSITVLLGLAGPQRSQVHAKATGEVLSQIDPEYVGALSLMVCPGTPMYDDFIAGRFKLIEPKEMLAELGTMIAYTDLSNGLFHANHASNYLPIRAKLPEEKEATLELIQKALAGEVALRPEWMRAL
jgi:radical SAM superfamily enzyme YgiQ (UPF0313 family)